jgi:ribosomal protein L19E
MAEERGLQSLVSPRRRTVRGEEARMLEAQRKRRERLESLYNEKATTPGQYGEAIYDAVKGMHPMDQIALATSFIPVVGDIAGGIADTRTLINDPSLTNLAFLLGGLVPFVPSGGIVRAGRGAYKEAAQKSATNLKNEIRNFYGDAGQVQKGAAFGRTIPEGLANIAQARYAPKAKALQEQYNISVADRKAAQNAIKVSEKITAQLKPLEAQIRAMRKEGKVDTEEFEALVEKAKGLRKEANTAGKAAVGQANQTRAMTKQYGGLPGIHRHYDQVDHIKTFKTFNTDDYFKTVGDLIPSGTGREGVEEIFKQIKTLPAIGYNPKKNYQMNIRRAHTGSAGKLEKRPQARLFYSDKIGKEGRASLVDIKNSVFLRYPTEASKKKKLQGFNTDKEFLEALDKTGIKILNRDEVLKGKPAVITGDATTDAFEIGGANYMTAIDKRGKVTQIVNDEHDLLSRKIPKTNIEVGKLPGADRFMNVSEPIVLDLINPAKKTTNIQKKAKDKLKKQKDEAADAAIEQYLKIPGVDISGPLPAGFKSHEQWARVQAIAKIQPDHPDYSRLIKEATIGSPTRVVRASEDGEQENKRGGGSVIERNPYNYSPKAIL